MALADIVKGKSLPEILKDKEGGGFFKDSIRNYYIIKRKNIYEHPMLKSAFKEMTEGFTKIFFNPKKNDITQQDSSS